MGKLKAWTNWVDRSVSDGTSRQAIEDVISAADSDIKNLLFEHYIKVTNLTDKTKETPNYKFNEPKYVQEALDYITNTYSEHYASEEPDSPQAFEGIVAAGNGKGFAMGNIQKLSARYGKKAGYNRMDLMKIIHYGILMLHVHDKRQAREDAKKNVGSNITFQSLEAASVNHSDYIRKAPYYGYSD